MIGVDANVLVYAVNAADARHQACREFLAEAVSSSQVILPWAVVYEFLRVVTHPKVMTKPLTIEQAWSFIEALAGHPRVLLIAEGNRHADLAATALRAPGVYGNLVYDAWIAAVLAEHGVRDFVTFDQDFRRFTDLRVRSV